MLSEHNRTNWKLRETTLTTINSSVRVQETRDRLKRSAARRLSPGNTFSTKSSTRPYPEFCFCCNRMPDRNESALLIPKPDTSASVFFSCLAEDARLIVILLPET